MILTNCRSSSLFFHSESGKGFMTLGLRRTFSHFNELLKFDSLYCRVTCSCLCFQYLPPLRATGFQFEEVPPVPSALSVIGFFFPWKAVQLWAYLDKTLYLVFWLSIFEVCLLEVLMVQDKVATNVWEYFLSQCRLCYTPCTGGVSFIFFLCCSF